LKTGAPRVNRGNVTGQKNEAQENITRLKKTAAVRACSQHSLIISLPILDQPTGRGDFQLFSCRPPTQRNGKKRKSH